MAVVGSCGLHCTHISCMEIRNQVDIGCCKRLSLLCKASRLFEKILVCNDTGSWQLLKNIRPLLSSSLCYCYLGKMIIFSTCFCSLFLCLKPCSSRTFCLLFLFSSNTLTKKKPSFLGLHGLPFCYYENNY